MKYKTSVDAIKNGCMHYYSGLPCPKGHISARYAKSFSCVQCGKERQEKLMKINGRKKRSIIPMEEIVLAASLAEDRKDFRIRFPLEYMAASKKKILPRLCAHMPPAKTRGIWDKSSIMKAALDFTIKSEFAKNHPGAHDAAIRLGIWNEVVSHMNRPNADFDVVYLWGFVENNQLYIKPGVTSDRLGTKRIEHVSNRSKKEIEYFVMKKRYDALSVEKQLKKIGIKSDLSGFNGSSEFRIMTKNELSYATYLVGN